VIQAGTKETLHEASIYISAQLIIYDLQISSKNKLPMPPGTRQLKEVFLWHPPEMIRTSDARFRKPTIVVEISTLSGYGATMGATITCPQHIRHTYILLKIWYYN